MSLLGAKKVIETSSIGFTHLDDFNDPFECTSFGFKKESGSIKNPHGYKKRFSDKYAVLSLTRQPLNALMWSHYGDSHRGVVIGIDVDAAGFGSFSDNFIPYQSGEIIYTKTKSLNDLDICEDNLMAIGEDIVFDTNLFNLAKRAFLYKSLEWAYEEEVRVVKEVGSLKASYHNSEGEFGDFNIIRMQGRPLWCFSIPKHSIKEVYLGKNVYENISRTDTVRQGDYTALIESWQQQGIQVNHCDVDYDSWNLSHRVKS